jgi:hypothetical protein
MKIERTFEDGEMIKTITAQEFQKSGALWLANSILHQMGMAIVYYPETDEIKPVICKFRGFSESCNDKGYLAVAEYMRDNIEELIKDCE